MLLDLPVEGDTANVWDTVLNNAFLVIDAHDHSTGKGTQVPTVGININADLTFAGFAAKHVKLLGLDEQASSAQVNSIWVKTDHNLYFRNNLGVDVQITAGNTINISVVGGIGGDYAAVGALFSYDDATRRYLAQQELVAGLRPWAGIASADLDIYEKASSIVNRVRLKSPAALAASYDVTWPAALPASTKRVYISSAGVMSTSRSDVLVIPAADAFGALDGLTAAKYQGTRWAMQDGGLGSTVTYPIDLDIGSIITGWTLYISKVTTNAVTLSALTHDTVSSTDTTTNGTSQDNAGNATGHATLGQTGLSLTVTAGHQYSVICGQSVGTAAGDLSYHLEVTYTEP